MKYISYEYQIKGVEIKVYQGSDGAILSYVVYMVRNY